MGEQVSVDLLGESGNPFGSDNLTKAQELAWKLITYATELSSVDDAELGVIWMGAYISCEQLKAMKMPKSHVGLFSWARFTQCLLNFEKMVGGGFVVHYDNYIVMELVWSDAVVWLGRNKLVVASRSNMSSQFTAFPPPHLQNLINETIDNYSINDGIVLN